MERRAQPNGTIMASKRVEIGLVSEALSIVPAAIYFVRLPSPPLDYFLDCLQRSWWDKAFNILLTDKPMISYYLRDQDKLIV